jgi:hypothetical protein
VVARQGPDKVMISTENPTPLARVPPRAQQLSPSCRLPLWPPISTPM